VLGFLKIFKQAGANFMADKAMRLAAALAFYAIFSLAPMLVIAISVAGFVFGDAAAMGVVRQELTASIGEAGAEVVQRMLLNAKNTGSGWMALVGFGLLFFTASGVFAQLKDALNTIWQIRLKPEHGIKGMLKDRLLAVGMVLSLGALLFLLLLASTLISILNNLIAEWFHLPGGFWGTLNSLISFGMVVVLFAVIYKVLPDAKLKWRHVWVGAGITAILFSFGKGVLALYLNRPETASVFGAAGALVVVMLWIYYSAIILLFGAEFTQAFCHYRGEKILPAAHATTLSAALRAREGLDERSSEEKESPD